ncbi:hypothetical protein [Streptomyces sp. MS2.AVA.5]|uniref:Uncharacterized protein n=1 Tax=Streptomyces achmelvichensis TaxID=3134111 RepID=A0ACC6PLT9_9ACTN
MPSIIASPKMTAADQGGTTDPIIEEALRRARQDGKSGSSR